MKRILVIAAVPQEVVLLEHTLGTTSRMGGIPFPYSEATIGRKNIFISTAGIGKINAAGAAAALIERIKPELVINTGCAGAYYGSSLSVGDIAVASHECLGDEGVATSKGWLDMTCIGLPTVIRGNTRYFNEFQLSKFHAEQALRLAECHGIKLLRGKFVTVSTCSGSRAHGDELSKRFGAICENMEGGAIAQICTNYGVDLLEVRGVSNIVEERDISKWDIPSSVEAAQRFVLKYLETLS